MGVCHLLVAGKKIAWMGTDLDDLGVVRPVETTKLEGCRLIPGLIDGHAHLTGGDGEAGFGSRVPPVPHEQFLSAGITTVVGVCGSSATW